MRLSQSLRHVNNAACGQDSGTQNPAQCSNLMMFMTDPTQRFSDRVENYIKYRPGYPNEVIETLRSECGLSPDSIVADIGSGTGILTAMFLRNGNEVYGIEPNREMREAAERLLKDYPRFHSVAAKAEETTLAG